MTDSKLSDTQIIATVGPASGKVETLEDMIAGGMDVARLNFSWGKLQEHAEYIENIKTAADICDKQVPVIQDLPGPRQQSDDGHEMQGGSSVITSRDEELIRFGLKHNVDYIAASFVRDDTDIQRAQELAGEVPVIAKIERKQALKNVSGIMQQADAIMVARGDLGKNIAIEKLPFVEESIIRQANQIGVPVITATDMLASMTDADMPTRAEVVDVAWAARLGSDAVMLSEETAIGDYPVESVRVMESIIQYAEQYRQENLSFNSL
jgi:pyruvate kinase